MMRMDADVASLRADWSSAYEVTYRPDPADDLPFKAVPRADPGALHARSVAGQADTLASLTAAWLQITTPDAA